MNPTTHDLHLTFDAMYEPGELKAVGYKSGEKVMEKTVATTGKAAMFKATADRDIMNAGGFAYIDISALDIEKRFVPTASMMIKVEVT